MLRVGIFVHILVVDNNQVLANFAVKYLLKYGQHTADIALGADTALTRVLGGKYDAILTEFRLPHQDVGLNLAKTLRDQGFRGLIIGLVTMPHTFTVEKMTEMGFNACLQKPLKKAHMGVLAMAPSTVCFEGDDLVYEKYHNNERPS